MISQSTSKIFRFWFRKYVLCIPKSVLIDNTLDPHSPPESNTDSSDSVSQLESNSLLLDSGANPSYINYPLPGMKEVKYTKFISNGQTSPTTHSEKISLPISPTTSLPAHTFTVTPHLHKNLLSVSEISKTYDILFQK